MTAFWPEGVPRAIGAMPATMAEALRRAAADRPDHVAIAFYGMELRYAAAPGPGGAARGLPAAPLRRRSR